MTFQLKISKGRNEGKLFSFAFEARIGRTPDNDLIVKDGGVSRNHARVYAEGGRHYLEDLGSANGTRLNGAPIDGSREINTGDGFSVGEVTFAFSHVQEELSEQPTAPGRAPAEDTQAEAEGSPDLGPPDVGQTAIRRVGLAPRRPATPSALPRGVGSESAADKARRRREASRTRLGRVLLAVGELPRAGKIAALALALALVAFGASGAISVIRGADALVSGPEPARLGSGRVSDSFGYGDGVNWSRPDMKIFSFELTTATRAVAVLRYQAAGISRDEVVIAVNGVGQGSVPPDTLDTQARELELVVPAASLKLREQNRVMFDNTRNPPGADPWRIWNLGLEIFPLPEVSPGELYRLAENDARRAKEFYDLRDVGPDNLFKAWKAYRNAWLTLEGLPTRPELYEWVRAQMRVIAPELDHQCWLMILEAQRFIQLKKPKKARQTLLDVGRFFPTREHRCQALAHQKLEEHGL